MASMSISVKNEAEIHWIWILELIVVFQYEYFKKKTKLRSILFESNSWLTRIESKAFWRSSRESTRIRQSVRLINVSVFHNLRLLWIWEETFCCGEWISLSSPLNVINNSPISVGHISIPFSLTLNLVWWKWQFRTIWRPLKTFWWWQTRSSNQKPWITQSFDQYWDSLSCLWDAINDSKIVWDAMDHQITSQLTVIEGSKSS
jgi:hypothetical protein